MIFILVLALIFLCYIKGTQTLAAVLGVCAVIQVALLFMFTSDELHQVLLLVSLGLWLAVLSGVYRSKAVIDLMRIQKG